MMVCVQVPCPVIVGVSYYIVGADCFFRTNPAFPTTPIAESGSVDHSKHHGLAGQNDPLYSPRRLERMVETDAVYW